MRAASSRSVSSECSEAVGHRAVADASLMYLHSCGGRVRHAPGVALEHLLWGVYRSNYSTRHWALDPRHAPFPSVRSGSLHSAARSRSTLAWGLHVGLTIRMVSIRAFAHHIRSAVTCARGARAPAPPSNVPPRPTLKAALTRARHVSPTAVHSCACLSGGRWPLYPHT